MAELDLTDKPYAVFNCDETGFSGKEHPRRKVICLKGRQAYQEQVRPGNEMA